LASLKINNLQAAENGKMPDLKFSDSLAIYPSFPVDKKKMRHAFHILNEMGDVEMGNEWKICILHFAGVF
jgi:hypothetical protein